ncbi:MAG: V8-like Glu-specific endopeptidase [Bacteriovoracaceae bacterium]|jgi:V8-like Glu-specific endopeptidase
MIKNLTILLLSLFAFKATAETRIVYGEDNRLDLKNVHDEKVQKIGDAIAGRVFKYSYTESEDKSSVAFDRVLSLSHPRSMNVCKEERFADQPTVADCTGFLVGENLLVTAGHCMVRMGQTVENDTSSACDSNSWMFDYKMDSKGSIDLKNVKADNIYNCKKVIYGKYEKDNDFALIELDRKVVGREPLKLNSKGTPNEGTEIFVMGHPTGLPLKYADGAKIFDINENYFTTNLDTFGGNSGSPVVNLETMEVEGILVRGDTDYYPHTTEDGKKCMKVNSCDSQRENCIEDDKNIKGEHVTVISKITDKL